MKDMNLLVWLTQLGISVAVPLAGFVLLAVWLRDRFGWGGWILWAGLALGLISAVNGFRSALQAMVQMTKKDQEDKDAKDPPAAFNDHD